MVAKRAKENGTNYPIASLVKRLLHLFRDTLDERLRPHGVTSAQLHVLAKLEHEPGISGARLARACLVTPQTTQVLLRGIEANGWIVRSKHPENERILLSTLTADGKRVLARSRTAVTQTYGSMLEGFTMEESSLLKALLGRCVYNLEGAERGEHGKPSHS